MRKPLFAMRFRGVFCVRTPLKKETLSKNGATIAQKGGLRK